MIREYRPEDFPQLEECFVELQEFERTLEPLREEGRALAQKYLEYMFRQCAETSGKVFVAEAEGRVAGFVSLWLKMKSNTLMDKEYEYAYVSDIVVLESHRGRGLGRALLEAAEDYSIRQGARMLRLGVLTKNSVARNLYTDFGFEEHAVSMSKNLKARDGDDA